MKETQNIICKVCRKIMTRTLDGKFDGVNKRWVDKNGSLWNGLNCPDCHRNKVKEHMKGKRHDKKSNASST